MYHHPLIYTILIWRKNVLFDWDKILFIKKKNLFFIKPSSATNNNAVDLLNMEHLLASLSVNSLANVCIFENDAHIENEEYFSYFHKLI